ncbi:MAG: hypothetical protein Q7T55_09395 [Solirubrobacteraceae bacterium]|nr:hypothetical protein [Solirubrobacteraceae bacterium]
MKIILFFLMLLFLLQCSSKLSNNTVLIKNKKTLDFGEYTVITGDCSKGSVIHIFLRGKSYFYSCGGDGVFGDMDTLDINKDGLMDFIFIYAFDDYSCLGMLVSDGDNSYESLSISNDIYKRYDCSVAPYNMDDINLKDFILIDIDQDGNKDIVTIAYRSIDGKFVLTGCSNIILYNQLMKKLKSPDRELFYLSQ